MRFTKPKTEAELLAERRRELDGLLTERQRLQVASDQSGGEARVAQMRLAAIETDGHALLTFDDAALEAERKKVRELLRAAARAEDALSDFNGQHPDLDGQAVALEAEERAAAQKAFRAQYRENLRRFLERGDAFVQAQIALNDMASEAERRWPGQSVIHNFNGAGFLVGYGVEPHSNHSWWRWLRCVVAAREPELFPADDPVHQEVAQCRQSNRGPAPYGPWRPVFAGFDRDLPLPADNNSA